MQTQADLLQIPVEVASSPHATAAGVAALARLGAGGARTLDEVVRRLDARTSATSPPSPPTEAAERLAGFERAVARLDRHDHDGRITVTDDHTYDVASSVPAWSAPPSGASWPATACAP